MPHSDQPIQPAEAGFRAVVRTARAEPSLDGDGMHLLRAIGSRTFSGHDPFLLLDEFRADAPPSGRALPGFPDHPHRGFETVTYMLAGRMHHRDSAGNAGVINAGGVQWMTAGRGIVHSETPEAVGGAVRGIQLWINLPAAEKMLVPRYQEFAAEAVVEVAAGDGRARLIAGAMANRQGPVQGVSTSPLYVDLSLPPGGTATIPVAPGVSAFIYGLDGAIETVGPEEVGAIGITPTMLGIFEDCGGGMVRLRARSEGARALLIAGRPIGEPVARSGPFVMNTHAEVIQAFDDYRAGNFTAWPPEGRIKRWD